jgi:hypothetical protein
MAGAAADGVAFDYDFVFNSNFFFDNFYVEKDELIRKLRIRIRIFGWMARSPIY